MKHHGFTLIELIVVIIVLGALAATAIPKFINLQDDAEKATLRGFGGALKSGVDVISAKHVLEGQPGNLKFESAEYPLGYYNINFVSPTSLQMMHYPISTSAAFCEAIWNVAVEEVLANQDPNSDAVVKVTHEFKPDLSRMRCNYDYLDIGTIYYMTGEGKICVQYQDDITPETCTI